VQLEDASSPEIVKTEQGVLGRLGSAASHAKKPVPEFTTMIPALPTLGMYTELLMKLRFEYCGRLRLIS
jgi:hypothetical protein